MNALDTATRPDAKPTSATLYFGPWYRRSPFFEKTLEAGALRLRHLQPHVPARATTPTRSRSTGRCSTT